jgi:hypothetical protein
MKLLMFQAKRFRYHTFEKTLEGESLAKVFKAL